MFLRSAAVVVGVLVAIVVGVNLMLYGRTLLLRRVGALLSSIPGPCIIWLTRHLLVWVMGERLWWHFLGSESLRDAGQGITLNDLLWIPVQDAEFYTVFALALLGLYLFRRSRREPRVEPLVRDFAFDRWLNRDRAAARRGGIVYAVLNTVAVLFAIPTTGLLSYVTLQGLLATGREWLLTDWVRWSGYVSGAIYALVYYIVNSAIALQDGAGNTVPEGTAGQVPPLSSGP